MTHRADLNLLVGRNKDEILIAVNTKYAETRRCGRTRDQLLWNCYLIEYRDNEEEEKKGGGGTWTVLSIIYLINETIL